MKLVIKIPQHKDLLITIDQVVDFETPLLKKSSEVYVPVPLSKILGFPPDKIFLNLKKFVGDQVRKGDLLAEYKGMFSTRQYLSEYEGILKEINHQTGDIIIEAESEDMNVIRCFFKGLVSQIDNDFIELTVSNAKEYDLSLPSSHFGGEVVYARPSTIATLTEDDVTGKIVYAEDIKPFDQVKLEALGAHGFITLNKLCKETNLPAVQLKQIDDFHTVLKLGLPYCVIGKDATSLHFYE